PLQGVAHAVPAQDLFHCRLELLQCLHRRVAQVEARLELAWNDVRGTGTRIEVGDLEGGRLEVLGPLVPLASGELRQCRRERVHRVLGELRVGDMPLHAVHGEAGAQGAATTHLDGVGDRDSARGLTHDAPIEALAPLAQDLRPTPRPIDRWTLLITGDQKCDRSLVSGVRRDELLAGGDHRRKSALHVGRSAAVQHSVADVRRERVAVPLLERPRGHDVGMPGEAEHRSRAAAAGPEVLDIAKAQALDGEAAGAALGIMNLLNARRMLLAVAGVVALAGAAQAADISGAGATFPYPVYSKWADAYRQKTGIGLNYQSIGSGGGIRQIKAKTVTFGASDMPLKPEELQEAGLVQFPMIIGGVVPVVNIKGVQAGQLVLDGATVAAI